VIKGCNKRVIVMKETGNAMIEEAFFILKAEPSGMGVTEGDIIKQANRILEKSRGDEKLFSLARPTQKSSGFSCFFSGAVIGALITAGLFLII